MRHRNYNDKPNAAIRDPHDIDTLPITSAERFSALGPRGIASILRLLAHINVFFPEPIKSGSANYRCQHRHPPGQERVNEVNLDESAATYDDQSQRKDQVYSAMEQARAGR
jgi:hypothetical protein